MYHLTGPSMAPVIMHYTPFSNKGEYADPATSYSINSVEDKGIEAAENAEIYGTSPS